MLIATLIQTDLYWQNTSANLAMLQQKIAPLKNKTQLIILPEMYNTGFTMKPELYAETTDGITLKWMKKMAAHTSAIVCGSVAIKDEAGNYYNQLLWVTPSGKYEYYNKRHLFAYAKENEYYTAGKQQLYTNVNGITVNCQVCYDLRFPIWARQPLNTPPYCVLLYIANWPKARNAAWQALLTARAIENQCYVIGVNRTGKDGNGVDHIGNSMVVNALGETLLNCGNKEGVHTISLDMQALKNIRSTFPFLKDADAYTIVTL